MKVLRVLLLGCLLTGLVACGDGLKSEATGGAGKKQKTFTNGIGQQMIWVKPGSFRMGDLNGTGGKDELPVRTVELSGYYLGATEVTQQQWQAVMGAEAKNPSRFQGAEHPVEQVNWLMATDYCRRLTESERAAGKLPEGYAYVLPTEAQWEHACRAGSEEDFSVKLDAGAWYSENSEGTSHPVATRKANDWGFSDMHGNVWEWCQDGFRSTYQGLAVRDPVGRGGLPARVLRGGSWSSGESLCRSSKRLYSKPRSRDTDLGFRVALAPVQAGE